MLALAAVRGVRPRQAEEGGDVIVGWLRQRVSAPAERHRRLSDRANSVPCVELAISEGPFAIFPGLAPGY